MHGGDSLNIITVYVGGLRLHCLGPQRPGCKELAAQYKGHDGGREFKDYRVSRELVIIPLVYVCGMGERYRGLFSMNQTCVLAVRKLTAIISAC